MGSQGSLGWDTLGWDTMGGPMGPWDRWDLGLKDPGPQGPPIMKLHIDYIMKLFIDTRPGPARPGQASLSRKKIWKNLVWLAGRSGAGCQASHLSRKTNLEKLGLAAGPVWCQLPAAGPAIFSKKKKTILNKKCSL